MKKILLWALVATSILAACTPSTAQPAIRISSPLVFTDNTMAGMSDTQMYAAYMQIQNISNTDDVLLSVTCKDAIATLHQSSVDANGIASMKDLESINIPANSTVEFKSGGLHIMLSGFKTPLIVGNTISIILNFKNAGEITVNAVISAR